MDSAGDDNALVPHQLRAAALTRIFGFEIMPAPFVISHLQIASLLEAAHAPLSDAHRAGVYLTNALTGWVPEQHPQSVIFEEFRQEREDSEQIKQEGVILVILGNPPYNGYAGIAKIEEERDLTEAYRTPVEGLPTPQGQGLNDLYIRFFRIAERRITSNSDGRGIISFISNNAWLDGLSHPTMRHNYLQSFRFLYIDNLNGDKYRTGKRTPDGHADPSAFSTPQNREGIQLGTAIATLVRDTTRSESELQYRDLWGAGKLAQLERESLHEANSEYGRIIPVRALGKPFAHRVHSTAYIGWPRLPELIPVSFPGVKTSRDPLLVDIDKDRLEARMLQYLGNEYSDTQMAELTPCAMKSSRRFKPIEVRRALQEKGFRPWQVLRYAYRPFDMRWLYWEPDTKLLDEKRAEYVQQAVFPSPCIVTQQKCRGESSAPQLISEPGCLDLLDRGASCFPATIISVAGTLFSDVHITPNLSVAASAQVGGIGGDEADLFFHALSIMHTPRYRSDNSGALLGDWPRIPLTQHAELLARSADLGRRLSALLDAESSLNLATEWSFLGALRLPTDVDLDQSLRITADWGRRGQGSTVMPGPGYGPTRLWKDVEREKLATLAATQSLSLDNMLALLGETCVDVHLNGDAHWSAVPANVWNYSLGGYQVLKKWLSYREFLILGRPLHPDEAAYFAQVVRRVTAILLLGPSLDASYQAILPTATGLETIH